MDVSRPKSRFLVLDFEANCSGNQQRDHEIIEFPCVLVDSTTGTVLAEFREFVHTVKTGPVSQFIQDLTGITTAQLKAYAVPWAECLARFEQWCERFNITSDNCVVVTCGDWDLRTMLPRQLLITGTVLSPRQQALFKQWCNMKETYRQAYAYRKLMGMDTMLMDMNLELIGRHHSGIDDCRNIARICVELQRRKGAIIAINRP